jgi:large subunit ribosomal protein L27
MAHKKSAGSTSLGRESNSQRLGIKLYAGEAARAGSIIVRQRGTKYRAGKNVKRGKDDTLFAIAAGLIKFTTRKIKTYDNQLKWVKFVNVEPITK